MFKEGDFVYIPATNNSFVNQYVEWRGVASDASPEYAETCAVAALASVAGRRLQVHIRQIPRPVNCNLYVLLLGPSTLSRKSNSIDSLSALLEQVPPTTLMSTPGSPEGLVQDLQRHEPTGATLFIDELAHFMQGMKGRTHMKAAQGYLLSAYDGNRISLRNKAKMVKGVLQEEETLVKEPALTIVAASTPERLSMVSGRDDVEDGWWPRWAVCWPQSWPPRQHLDTDDHGQRAMHEAIAERLRNISLRLGHSRKAVFPPEALAKAQEYIEEFENTIETDLENSSLYGRVDLRIFKVAALLALGSEQTPDGDIYVSVDNVQDAYRICYRWLSSARLLVNKLGSDEFEQKVNRTLGYVRRAGGSELRSVVANAMHYRAREFMEIEQSLVERGLIAVLDHPQTGKPLWAVVDMVWRDGEGEASSDVVAEAETLIRRKGGEN